MRSNVSSTSSLVTASPVRPLMRAAYRTTTASNQPQRRGRPVVAPNSLPNLRTTAPNGSSSSVGSGPLPTRVVYAFTTPKTASIDVGASPAPVAAPPDVVLLDVTNGYVPWSTSSSEPCAPSSSTAAPANRARCTASPTSSASTSSRGANRSSNATVSSAFARLSEPDAASWTFACSIPPCTNSRSRSTCRRSCTRMPRRATLSSYAGPMPRPVVPIARLAALSQSSNLWYGSTRCARSLTYKRPSTSTPSRTSSSISVNSVSGSSTTPLPMAHRTPGWRMPLGICCSTNWRPPRCTVCPAFAPPWYRTTQSARSAITSTSFPFPSSPHWAPTTHNVRTSESNMTQGSRRRDIFA